MAQGSMVMDVEEKRSLYLRLEDMATSITKLQSLVVVGGTFITLLIAILGYWNNYTITRYDDAYNSVIRLEVRQELMQVDMAAIKNIEHIDSRPATSALNAETARIRVITEANNSRIVALERTNQQLTGQMERAIHLLTELTEGRDGT